MENKVPLIEMRGIKKSYYLASGEEVPVLKGIDLVIQRGEFIALMGESGGGKTTLLNVIGLLHYPTQGEYFINGEDVGAVQDDHTRAFIRNKKIGFIFQSFNLINSISALRNVILPSLYRSISREVREERARGLLTQVGLSDRMDHKPKELSGGQQQRVSIARSLINDPDIVLADEPTGALDSQTGEQVMELLRDLHKQGKTIIMVTHSAETAKYADRIIFLADGAVISNNYELSHV